MAKFTGVICSRAFPHRLVPLAALLCLHVTGATPSFAAEVKVTDCDGTPRAIREVADGTKTSVELRVTNASGSAISDIGYFLSSTSSNLEGANFRTIVVDGRGSFKDVPAGNWRICLSSEANQPEAASAEPQGTQLSPTAVDATVSQVAIITADDEGTTSAATWIGGAGVALTGMGLGVFSGQGSSGDTVPSSTGGAETPGDDEPATAPLLPADEAASPGASSGESPSNRPGKIACPAEEDCLNDERPNPVAPISPST